MILIIIVFTVIVSWRWIGQYRLNSDSDSCDKIYIPQLRDDHEPKSGQGFESLDDAHEFYNNYAKEAGFSVRINYSRKNKETNAILRKEYVCSKEGVPYVLLERVVRQS